VTFKDLQKLVQSHSTAQQNELLFGRLKDKPFWIWNIEEHKQQVIANKGDCCFNHIIGLPRKEKLEKPMLDYEKLFYNSGYITRSNQLNYILDFQTVNVVVTQVLIPIPLMTAAAICFIFKLAWI
jgi:hypothetical protein